MKPHQWNDAVAVSKWIDTMEQVFMHETGRTLLLKQAMYRQSLWIAWRECGWDRSELELVCRHLRRAKMPPEMLMNSMTFNGLIADCSKFQEKLENARGFFRNAPRPHASDEVRRVTGRQTVQEQAQHHERKVGEIIQTQAFQELVKFKDRL